MNIVLKTLPVSGKYNGAVYLTLCDLPKGKNIGFSTYFAVVKIRNLEEMKLVLGLNFAIFKDEKIQRNTLKASNSFTRENNKILTCGIKVFTLDSDFVFNHIESSVVTIEKLKKAIKQLNNEIVSPFAMKAITKNLPVYTLPEDLEQIILEGYFDYCLPLRNMFTVKSR